ncbi:MAG: SPOR domain-containing protein [Dysgonamonadaceae bacterium]|nr:SPOR domain-containing protein [Dysgonamonadaceae bacterium]
MQKTFLHLIHLLTKHECVVIPGFGAFVVYPDPLSFSQTFGRIYAPTVAVGFNPELVHNDGLLTHSIMAAQQISYNEANLHVRRFSEELALRLKEERKVEIPLLGKLQLSSESKIIFSPVDLPVCNAVNYGFSHFTIPLLADQKMPRVADDSGQKDADVLWIPLNKRILKAVGSVAAVVLLFLLFSTPLGEQTTRTNSAVLFSMIGKQMPQPLHEVVFPITVDEDSVHIDTVDINITNIDHDDINPTNIDAIYANIDEIDIVTNVEVEKTTSEPAATPAVESETINKKRYYIVVGSLPTQRLAEKELSIVQAHFQRAAILQSNGRFRIYVEQFADKKEAETYLNGFRAKNPAYEDAWLLSHR